MHSGFCFGLFFLLLWRDRADFALESQTAVVDLAGALMVLKHYEAQGLLPCESCRQADKRDFAPKSLLWWGGTWSRVGVRKEERGWCWEQKPLFTPCALVARGPLVSEAGWSWLSWLYFIKALFAEETGKWKLSKDAFIGCHFSPPISSFDALYHIFAPLCSIAMF